MTARATIHGLYCPNCRNRIGAVVAESAPVFIKHDRSWRQDGASVRCHREFIVLPGKGEPRMIEVNGRVESDTMLTAYAMEWIDRHSAQVVTDVLGFSGDRL